MSARRRGRSDGPDLTVALLAPADRRVPPETIEAAQQVGDEVLVVGAADVPQLPGGVRAVGTMRGDLAGLVDAALGSATGRWTLVVRAGEEPHTPHARTLARYLRHETAGGFFVPWNDRLPLLRVLPTAAGRLWTDDPMPVQAMLEAHPERRLMTSEGLMLQQGPTFAWPTVPTRPAPPWLRLTRAVAAGHMAAAARHLRRLPFGLGASPEGRRVAGEIAFWRESWPQAAQHWQAAIAASAHLSAPQARAAGVGLGRLAEVAGDLDGARDAYDAVLAAAPLDRVALVRLLSVEWRLGVPWPDSLARLLDRCPWAWRAIGRSLDAIVPPAAQVRTLRSTAVTRSRDLLMARAALATGDLALARRSLDRLDSVNSPSGVTYQGWLTELLGGSAAQARAAATRAADLTGPARLSLLLAAGAVLGEATELPTLRPDESLEVGQWLLVVLSDLSLLRLDAQAAVVADLATRLLGPVGRLQAQRIRWRSARADRAPGLRTRARPVRDLVIRPPARRVPWLATGDGFDLKGVHPWPPR